MSTGIAAAVGFRIVNPTVSAGAFVPVTHAASRTIRLDRNVVEALEDFEDVREMHLAFSDPRNETPIPWAKVKKKLKL